RGPIRHANRIRGFEPLIRSSPATVCFRLRATQRQAESERRTHTHLALHPDPAPVQLDELPTEGQPQPRTLHLLLRCPHLAELLEPRLLILWGDAHAGVADGDLD